MSDSIFDPRRDSNPHDDALIADLQERLAPLRFNSRPLDFDGLVRETDDESQDARIAKAKSSIVPSSFLHLAPATRWLAAAASLAIVAALSLWSMQTKNLAIADNTQTPQTIATPQTTHEITPNETRAAFDHPRQQEQAPRVAVNAPDVSPITFVRRQAEATPRRARQAKRFDNVPRSQRERDTTQPDPSADATGDLLLAIRVTGDTLDRTGRQLAARFASASYVPDSKFLRSLNPNETVLQENRP